jgi:hypothetical protein
MGDPGLSPRAGYGYGIDPLFRGAAWSSRPERGGVSAERGTMGAHGVLPGSAQRFLGECACLDVHVVRRGPRGRGFDSVIEQQYWWGRRRRGRAWQGPCLDRLQEVVRGISMGADDGAVSMEDVLVSIMVVGSVSKSVLM